MKKYLSIFLSGLLLASCMDSDIIPYGQTVEQDYWKTKSDVAQIVTRAYSGMANEAIAKRLIVWGGFRSDELILSGEVPLTNATRQSLAQIKTANLETTNEFNDWSAFYSVINYCNICIEKAPSVVGTDPEYLQGDCNLDVAQMKALRSLCYFYLVRAFRDVPYITTGYRNSSQEMNIAQSAPSVVLQGCIDDLEAASQDIYDAKNFALGTWKSRGYLNRDAVYAILADIYLWRASVLHGSNPAQAQSDYQKCIDYCTLVIDSKNEYHKSTIRGGQMDDTENAYPALGSTTTYFGDLFTNQGVNTKNQNAEESIFEIEFGGNNAAIRQFYYSYDGSAEYGYMKAPTLFGSFGTNGAYINGYDLRKRSVYFTSGGAESYAIRKLVTDNDVNPTQSSTYSREAGLTNIAHNMILYRMTDVMLMKAEALTQLAYFDEANAPETPEDSESSESSDTSESSDIQPTASKLEQAFELVNAVYTRACDPAVPKLAFSSYNSVEGMEAFILAERFRELSFESKRWYDLLRYNYRQNAKQGLSTNYDVILADQAEYLPNNIDMMTLMTRSLSEPRAVTTKITTEPFLYMPVYENEMNLNSALKQNPVYSSDDQFKRVDD